MRKSILSCLAGALLLAVPGQAQTIWDINHLREVKRQLTAPVYRTAYERLLSDADKALAQQPVSVMMKDKVAVSGDKHDYLSLSRYFWPDPSKPNGLPYISRDGESNPELERLDRNRLSTMASGVTTLSLAYYFSNDERYAAKAVQLLRTWFLNPETRMNPNLSYAQIVPGRYNGQGRCYGVIDGYSFVEMLDGVQLLQSSKAFTSKDQKQLKAWFTKFLQWLLTSEQGQEEGRQKNNHATAHDVQIIAYARYVGNKAVMNKVLSEFAAKRLYTQIEPDGRQPYELRRTLAFGYSQFNLSHIIDVCQIAAKDGIRLDTLTSSDGRNFYKAMNFLLPYLGAPRKRWPYKQISQWEEKQEAFAQDVYRTYLLNPAKNGRFADAFRKKGLKNYTDRFFLLYYRPDSTDQQLAAADQQLRFALQCVEKRQQELQGKAGGQLRFPRSVEKDGSLRLVAPRDWCSGFFAGSLWQLYGATRNPFWRKQAVRFTWPLESLQDYKGTHDLGFMVYNSFGKAYELTGEQSYRDVVLQAARSLATRYNDTVKCIRSWSWGKDKWHYPVIIDNMMNLELLFRAYQLTGEKRFYDIAVAHAQTTLKNHFRPDGSSFHVVDYDPSTGRVLRQMTYQGLNDASVWSRGQAWGLYGFTMAYRFAKKKDFLAQAEKIADFFFQQPGLPADLVPYWDMSAPHTEQTPRDASAASIMASALYELSRYVSAEKAQRYRNRADRLLHSLSTRYAAPQNGAQGFLLLHATGNHPAGDEIDTAINYADYYYLEALLRQANFKKKGSQQ